MKILFIGDNKGGSFREYLALKKVYKNVDLINPFDSFFLKDISKKIFFHISPKIFEPTINKYILSRINKFYDLIFVRNGEYIGKNLILKLKKKTNKIIFFCHDNPFVFRDKQRFKLCLPALKYYDLIVFQQSSRIKSCKKYGVRKILLVLPCYDKKIHRSQKITTEKKKNIQTM